MFASQKTVVLINTGFLFVFSRNAQAAVSARYWRPIRLRQTVYRGS